MSETRFARGETVEITRNRDKGQRGTVLGSHYDREKDERVYLVHIPGAQVWKYAWQLKRVESAGKA